MLFIIAAKIYKFKAKFSEIKTYLLCLGKISKEFTVINLKNAGLNGYVYDFSVDYNIIGTSIIINIHKYLMKKHDIWFIKKMFVAWLAGIVNASNQAKFLSLK